MSDLPELLRRIASVTSLRAALDLAREHGGLQISLSDAPGSALVRVVGPEAATAIVSHLGRGKVTVPMANVRGQRARRAQAAKLLASGETATQVARICDVHMRTVWRVKAAVKDDDLPLFDRED